MASGLRLTRLEEAVVVWTVCRLASMVMVIDGSGGDGDGKVVE
jgi:hypothetical protein